MAKERPKVWGLARNVFRPTAIPIYCVGLNFSKWFGSLRVVEDRRSLPNHCGVSARDFSGKGEDLWKRSVVTLGRMFYHMRQLQARDIEERLFYTFRVKDSYNRRWWVTWVWSPVGQGWQIAAHAGNVLARSGFRFKVLFDAKEGV